MAVYREAVHDVYRMQPQGFDDPSSPRMMIQA